MPPGQVGRLAVRGPTGCKYLADQRQKSYVQKGWNLTGDAYLIDPTDGQFVYQQLAPIRARDGNYPVFGSWVVNGVACGVGIREDRSIVTGNTSRFVPHQMID